MPIPACRDAINRVSTKFMCLAINNKYDLCPSQHVEMRLIASLHNLFVSRETNGKLWC
ncbi:MAG: hypothetical protein KME64_21675 [Scytonematopsis contorta HA4267-MV1]|nr:hypothetical protein [Scytonematopsis contorta HA4267-MV1]